MTKVALIKLTFIISEILFIALNKMPKPIPPSTPAFLLLAFSGLFNKWSKVIILVNDVLKLSVMLRCNMPCVSKLESASEPLIVSLLSGVVVPIPKLPELVAK